MENRTNPLPRFLAPIALVAVAVVILVMIGSSLGGSGSSSQAKRQTTTTAKTTTTTKKKDSGAKSTYVVQPGDSFSLIAEKTGISVERLTQLNPTVDTQALISGQKIRLR